MKLYAWNILSLFAMILFLGSVRPDPIPDPDPNPIFGFGGFRRGYGFSRGFGGFGGFRRGFGFGRGFGGGFGRGFGYYG
ncbi:UNVERIFIED_CONTAM: hypothetical protein RMT77_019836 [Armadillidium vulgare]